MKQAIFCPLCQPEAQSGERQATITVTFDKALAIDCARCGQYRLPNEKRLAALMLSEIQPETREKIKRIVISENKLGFVTRLDHQILN